MVKHQDDPLDAVFGALAHPARRRMLEHLASGAASVGELAEPFRMSAPAISRHLRVLEGAGLVVRERDGRVHRMDMAGGTLAGALAWLDTNHRFWSQRLDRIAALVEDDDSPAPAVPDPAPAPAPPEVPVWPHPRPAPASRSRSNASTRRRPRASSRRSRRPRK